MKNAPDRIFLQVGPNIDADDDFNEMTGITWCSAKLFDNDIEYVRIDLVAALIEKVRGEIRDTAHITSRDQHLKN